MNFKYMKITIKRQELQAALLFASNDESRFVINGICIEAKPHQQPILISTDGRRMAVIESFAEQQEECEIFHTIILRPDFLKAFISLSKACGGKLFPLMTFSNNPGSKQLQVSLVGPAVFLDIEKDALIEGKYPDWRQVMPPKKANREPVNDLGLDAEFMADFAKAAKLMEAESPSVQMNLVGKDSAVEVRINALPNFYGVIMPVKTQEDVNYQPDFLKALTAPEAKAA